jgi:hypothetical protein
MKNRYGDFYEFKRISENQVAIVGELKYWRFGGHEGQDGVDLNDVSFADPSGGPFIELGMSVLGRKIVKISASGNEGEYVVLTLEEFCE